MKPLLVTICLSIAISVLIPSLIEPEPYPYHVSQKATYMVLADQIATAQAVPIPLVKRVINCESTWKADATHISKREQSYGLVQINRLAHPDISVNEAENPDFAIGYLAHGLKTNPGQWSCYKKVMHK